MKMRRVALAPLLLWAPLPIGVAAAQQTAEEIRYQAELRACAAMAEAQRKPCEDGVRARITAAWKARIEEQARRRQSN
jgi:hypothetical protein